LAHEIRTKEEEAMNTKTNRWALLHGVAALTLLAAGTAAAPAVARAKPTPAAGTTTACSSIKSNTNAKGGLALDRLGCVPTGLPDLRAGGGCDRTTISSGGTFTCTLELHNDGTGAATFLAASTIIGGVTVGTGFQITSILNAWACDMALDFSAADLCFPRDTTVAPGGVVAFTIAVKAPSVSCLDPAVAGEFAAALDPDGAVTETDETNNELTVGLTVNPLGC